MGDHRNARRPQGCLSSGEVLALSGVTARQLDYWCRTGVIDPLNEGRGSGIWRWFSRREVSCVLAVRLLAGNLHRERQAWEHSHLLIAAMLNEIRGAALVRGMVFAATSSGEAFHGTPGDVATAIDAHRITRNLTLLDGDR